MYKNKLIYGIITARGGSKSIPNKNIKKINGKPLIYYSIATSLKSKLIDRTIMSTDSSKILSHAHSLMLNSKYIINNIDITLILEEPKIKKYKDNMCQNISSLLHCNSDLINIKATTSESIGFVGRGEGIACHAIVSIISD